MNIQENCHIEIELVFRSGHREYFALDLVQDDQADFEKGFLGYSTPLAMAIWGVKSGTLVPYFTDDLEAVQILSVSESTRTRDTQVSSCREETLRDTLMQIQFRDALLFASSTDTKWGAYDADGLDFDRWKSSQDEPLD